MENLNSYKPHKSEENRSWDNLVAEWKKFLRGLGSSPQQIEEAFKTEIKELTDKVSLEYQIRRKPFAACALALVAGVVFGAKSKDLINGAPKQGAVRSIQTPNMFSFKETVLPVIANATLSLILSRLNDVSKKPSEVQNGNSVSSS